MSAVYRGRRMPAAWSPPGGVVTAQVDRRTGMAMDASCPGSGDLYTEYFIHRLPPAQTCYPTAAYPPMAMGDTGWVDDEGGAWSYVDTVGTSDLQRRGIDWPELEEKRRREARGTPPPAPLPGSVEDPYGDAAPPPPPPPAAPRPRPRPAPVASDGRDESGDGSTGRRQPRVIGRPVEGPTEGSPPPPPAKPDSAGSLR
jgi:hypothetical protein